jgi:hypothetical protein
MRTRTLPLLVLIAIAGCAENDPNRFCRSDEFTKSSPSPWVTVEIEGFPYRPVVVGDTIHVTATSSGYDRNGQCLIDPSEMTYQWSISPPGAVALDGVVTQAHGSRISFKLTTSSLNAISVDVSHPRLETVHERTDPFPIYTPQQAQINQLMDDVDRLYGYDALAAPERAPDQLRLLQARLSRAMQAIFANDPKLAAEHLEAFRSEIRTMRAVDEAWAPVLLRTDTVVDEVRALGGERDVPR